MTAPVGPVQAYHSGSNLVAAVVAEPHTACLDLVRGELLRLPPVGGG